MREGVRRGGAHVAAIVVAGLAVIAPAAAAQVLPYQANDGRGFHNVLPSGQAGLFNAGQLAGYVAGGTRPAHSNDQLRMYADLVYASPGLRAADLRRYFKDASFGTQTSERTYSPRSDVTIVRDRDFGVPHVYGSTRAGVMFGAGYAGAEDRLFFMDVLRNAGRAKLSAFAGGANTGMDEEQWSLAPYTESDLQRQVDQYDDLYGVEGRQIQSDFQSYVEGVNQYIREARLLLPLKMPGEYAALGKIFGPEDWKTTDIVSTAALVGGIFGKGGGGELDSALVLQEAQRRFGRTGGRGVWSDFRSADDPEAPTTVASRRFSYQAPPRRVRAGSTAMPDRGSVRRHPIVSAETGGSATTRDERPGVRAIGGSPGRSPLGGKLEFPTAASNALLVSARESESGHPVAVMGPQTGYFNPQILTEVDLHGPGIDARGATFVGVSLYVQLGRGRDYAFSATSASQDNTDTFALDLCEPSGAPAAIGSMHYRYRGACRPIEVVTRTNAWQSNLADSTPAGTQTLRAERTKLGLVTARATVRGKPVIYTKLRSTYMHEVDSARGFSDFNNPQAVRSAADFQRAAAKIGYTFNWFYADHRDIAYFNSGDNPLRAPNVDQSLPVAGRFEWQGFDPELVTARYTPFGRHPQAINQSYLTSWNNKQARGYRAADSNFGFSPIYRSLLLDSRVRRGIRGSAKMSLVELIDAMEDAGTVDLRGDRVLPYALRVIGRPRDARLRRAADTLADWVRSGAHRRDRDRNGVYEHAEAVRIMDAWWPRMVAAQFRPALGRSLFERLSAIQGIDNEPNNHGGHLGSAYQNGWYGYSQKDLRTVLGRAGRGNLRGLRGAPAPGARYSRAYCGGDFRARGSRRAAVRLRRCRAALTASLSEALTIPAARLYRPDPICDAQPGLGPADPGRKPGDQLCFDAVWMRALGAAQQPLFHWINRPTFQQAVEVQGRVGR